MKVRFYTEKVYGSELLAQYEYIPIREMKQNDEVIIRLNDIIKGLPTMFVKMQKILLNTSENFQKCLERRPEMKAKYKQSNQYNFYYKNTKLPFNTKFVLTHNLANPKKNFWNLHYIEEDSVVKIVVCPEKCTLCQDAFINKIEKDNCTIYECLKCIDKQKKWEEEYEEKKKYMDNYSPWNNFQCDDCELFGHECRNCRHFNSGILI